MSNKIKILRAAIWYTGNSFIGRAIAIPKGIIVGLVLMPSEFGLYNSIYLWFHYLSMVNIGLLSTAGRESAYYFGQEEKEALGIEVQNKAIAIDFLITLGITVAFFCYSFKQQGSFMVTCYLLVGISYLLNKISGYYERFNAARNRFEGVAKANLIGNLVGPILIMFSIFYLGIYALLIMPVVGVVVKIVYYRKKFPLAFHPVRSFSGMMPFLYSGLFFGISSALSTLYYVVDRTFIKLYLNNTIMGLYSFSLVFTMMMFTLFTNVQSICLDTLNKSSGNVNSEEMLDKATRYIIYLLLFGALMITISLPCYYILVNYFLTNYRESGPIFVIFSLMVYFYAMFVLPSALLTSRLMQKEKLMAFIMSVGVVSGIIGNAIFVYLGWKGEGIALGTVISQAVTAGLTLFAFAKYSRKYNLRQMKEIIGLTIFITLYIGTFYYMVVNEYVLWKLISCCLLAVLSLWAITVFYYQVHLFMAFIGLMRNVVKLPA